MESQRPHTLHPPHTPPHGQRCGNGSSRTGPKRVILVAPIPMGGPVAPDGCEAMPREPSWAVTVLILCQKCRVQMPEEAVKGVLRGRDQLRRLGGGLVGTMLNANVDRPSRSGSATRPPPRTEDGHRPHARQLAPRYRHAYSRSKVPCPLHNSPAATKFRPTMPNQQK